MLTFRRLLEKTDGRTVRKIVTSTGFFKAAPDEIDVAVELVETALSEGMEKSGYHFIFAKEGDDVLGYTCYGPIPCTVGSFDLYWIAVSKDAQGKGVGKALMNEVFKDVRKMKGRGLYLETSGRKQYAPTRRFYEACGFALAARLKDYYGKGDDMLTFRHTL